MSNFDNVHDLEIDNASDATNTTPKAATKRGKKAGGTTARKQPKNGSAESRVIPVDDAELDQQLDDCKEVAISSKLFLARTNDALYRAFAKSYVWWRICTQVDKRVDRYLKRYKIKARTDAREFTSLIRLTYDFNGNGMGNAEKRLETKTVNRFATAMDSIHWYFKGTTLTFNDEAEIVAYIRQEGGVETLIQKALGRKSGSSESRSIRRTENLQAGTKSMKRANPLAIIPKHSHDLERDNEEDRDFIILLGEIDHSGDVKVLSCLRHKSMVRSLLTSIGSDHFQKTAKPRPNQKRHSRKPILRTCKTSLLLTPRKRRLKPRPKQLPRCQHDLRRHLCASVPGGHRALQR